MPIVPKPDVVAALDAEVAELMRLATEQYRWLHGTAHSNPKRGIGGGGKGGHSDPTAGAVLNPWNDSCRAAMAQAHREMKNARRAALAAYRALARANENEPDHQYEPEVNDYTQRDELGRLRGAQRRRQRRGEGWGEA